MATTARQSKPARKGAAEPARRPQAWTGARASPTFTPSGSSPRPQPAPPASSTPTPGHQNGARSDAARDRILQSLAGLTGTTVTLLTKTSQRYEGVVFSTSSEGDTTGVTLKDVKEITSPGASLKDIFFIASTNIESWTSGPADAKIPNGDSFRTDADISQKKGLGRERELQAWASDASVAPVLTAPGDDDTFGPGSTGNASWDQFTANEQLFGVKASFDEDIYTTKLDRSAPDFKERERKAQRIANEIIGAATNNPHIAEERGFDIDDSGVNEEDKYGAVVRGTNAYVPPGARTKGGLSPPVNNAANATKPDIPKVSVNGPDGSNVVPSTQSSSSPKPPSPAPPGPGATNHSNKPPADPLPAFRDFVTNEKQRLTQKRQALVKSEMDKRMADLIKFSQNFKLNKPIPDDLVSILAKDEEKQRQIREKANKDASSAQARSIGASTPATASRGVVAGAKIPDSARKPGAALPTSKTVASNLGQHPPSAAQKVTTGTKTTIEPTNKKAVNMFIQPIPPFKGGKAKQSSNPSITASVSTPKVTTSNTNGATSAPSPPAQTPVSPNTAANRLNVNASSFRPVAKSSASPNPTPSASASVSPRPKSESSPSTPNPFYGTRPFKKGPPVHIKDDFNPFKHNKVVDASQVSAIWPYNGKRYMQMFPPLQHPPQHPHMVPPIPPPIPPPSYEEDSAAQAAQRGYVYAYPYPYPGQPMMPGMPPPGPPGTYMPGPFMQHMPYPPGMPPPSAMYSPAMGQMPPPQAYMQPPPPGAYPPPNGAGPRPSMPPTPIPSHAHPYYHQSPQLQHAVPYQMMMPPPPPNAPHPYDGAPPVQMGGHA